METLTPGTTPYKLFAILFENLDKVVSYEEITRATYGIKEDGTTMKPSKGFAGHCANSKDLLTP